MLTKNQILTDSELLSLCNILRVYQTGTWLYPGVIARKVPLTVEKTYAVTDLLTQYGYIKAYYELYCSNCQRATGEIYETLTEMPAEFECELCHATMTSMQNSILVFKVIAE